MTPRPILDVRVTFDPIGSVPDRDYVPEFLHDRTEYGIRKVAAYELRQPVAAACGDLVVTPFDIVLVLVDRDDEDDS